MNTLRYVGHDEPLTTEQGLFIRDRAVEAARRTFVGRKLFGTSIRKIDSGTQTFGYDTLTHVSAASFDYSWPGRQSQDIVNLSRSTVAIPILHKEFEINKLDLASSRLSGVPLNTTNAESAAYKVATLEDLMLILGYTATGTTYEVSGLYASAGNTDAATGTWDTPANIVSSMQDGIALLEADNIFAPYNLTVHPNQHADMLELISNTAVTYEMLVTQMLRGGSITVTPAITSETAMLTAANPNGAFEYVLAEDVTTDTETTSLKEGNNLFGRVYLRGLPVVYDANAICSLTGL
jgi:uncharacterized linocin/CFP29 family protein